jgi:hypothetical protein
VARRCVDADPQDLLFGRGGQTLAPVRTIRLIRLIRSIRTIRVREHFFLDVSFVLNVRWSSS